MALWMWVALGALGLLAVTLMCFVASSTVSQGEGR